MGPANQQEDTMASLNRDARTPMTPTQASLNMMCSGGADNLVCPWWWPSFAEVQSPSNNSDKFGNLISGSTAGRPDVTAISTSGALGAWGHSMHTNNMPVATRA